MSKLKHSQRRTVSLLAGSYENGEQIGLAIRVLSVAGIVALLLCLAILAATPPAGVYELSIYGAYPLYFWFLIVFTNAAGIVLILDSAVHERSSLTALCGVFFILLTNFIVVALPLLRGYAFYGVDDSVVHLGYVNQIILTGHTTFQDYYPASHLIVALISSISNLQPQSAMMASTPILWLGYIVGGFLLARTITKTQVQALLIFAFIAELPIGLYSAEFYPYSIAFFFVPFALYAYFRATSSEFRVIFVIFALALVFTHSEIALVLITILFVHAVVAFTCSRNGVRTHRLAPVSLTAIFIMFIAFVGWFTSFAVFSSHLVSLADFLTGGVPVTYLSSLQDAAARSSLPLSVYASQALKIDGQMLIYVFLFAIGVALLFNAFRTQRGRVQNQLFFAVSGVILGIVALGVYVSGLSAVGGPDRIVLPALFMCAVFNGLVYSKLIGEITSKYRRSLLSVFAAALIIASALGMFAAHDSPWILLPSHGVSDSEWAGGLFYAKNSNLNVSTVAIYNLLGTRMRFFVYGYNVGLASRFVGATTHFGYNASIHSVAGPNYNNSIITVTAMDLLFYQELWPTRGRFNSTDFAMLANDSGAALVYSNGEISLYYVGG